MSKGQKWGTYHKDEWTAVHAHLSDEKREQVKELAKSKNLTVSAMINKLLSIELAKAGYSDYSASYEL